MTCHIENDTMSCHVMSCHTDMTFTTDTYRNNMDDFVLIHLTGDEIYVRTLTVYILQFYQLKNPQSFIILF